MQSIPHLRTFAGRHGRLSDTQKQALSLLMNRYQMPPGPWRFEEIFARQEVIIEIGCGNGVAAVAFAQHHPEKALIAIDVHTPGIAQLLTEIDQLNLINLRVQIGDALTILKDQVFDKSVTAFHIFFPDPWPKKRHHKRRILTETNLNLFRKKLKNDGYILVATDWQEYADQIQAELGATVSQRPDWRPITKFEKRALNEGRKITELTLYS